MGILALCALGYLGNILHAKILFGIDFIFGSIAVLLTVLAYGRSAAVLVAAVSSTYTITLWHQPYYPLLAVAEALFVSLVYRRLMGNLLVATTLYWLLPGAGLLALIYGKLLGIEATTTVFIGLKQSINGIFNAMVASGIVSLVGALRSSKMRVPLQQAYFNTLVAVVFLPVLTFALIASRTKMDNIQREILKDTVKQGEIIRHFLILWQQQGLEAVSALARTAADKGLRPSNELQEAVHLIHAAFPAFHDMYVADAQARTVGFDPPRDARGKSLIGLDFSDRRYYHQVKATRRPLIDDVLLGRGGIDFPIVCFVAPALDGQGDFAGFALGATDVRKLGETLSYLISAPSTRIVLSDRQGTVVASTVPGVAPLDPIGRYLGQSDGSFEWLSPTSYRKEGPASSSTAYSVWQKMTFGSVLTIPELGWRIHVESSLGHYLRDAEAIYVESFAQMLVLTLGAMVLSFLVVHWVSRPVERLASFTSAIARQPLAEPNLSWPRSRFTEIAALIDNFRAMVENLRQRFGDLSREVQERKDTEVRLKKAMEEARAANVAKSEFLANMSHEIRTPLGAVIGYTQLLASARLDDDERQSSIAAILRNGQQLAQLVDDILDLAKIEAGHLKIAADWLTIDDLVAGGIEALTQKADDKGLSLAVVGVGSFPERLYVDPVRLRQILLNIVGNAIKFTETGGVEVTMKIERLPDRRDLGRLALTVADTGIGIAPEAARTLFQPFVQADASYARRFGGTGLGLALSRVLAEALGGHVRLERSEYGKGSVFAIELQVGLAPEGGWHPTLAAARRATQTSPVPLSRPSELAGYRILLVEDSPDNRTLISRMLERYGAEVHCAASGEEGVIKAQAETWDVILMDMQMPVVDGYQATRTLRERGYARPIIAVTAHALPEEKKRCLDAGCDSHVSKPIHWGVLVQLIREMIQRASQQVGVVTGQGAVTRS